MTTAKVWNGSEWVVVGVGTQGPQGPQGLIGPTGPTGPTGTVTSATEPADTSVLWIDESDSDPLLYLPPSPVYVTPGSWQLHIASTTKAYNTTNRLVFEQLALSPVVDCTLTEFSFRTGGQVAGSAIAFGVYECDQATRMPTTRVGIITSNFSCDIPAGIQTITGLSIQVYAGKSYRIAHAAAGSPSIYGVVPGTGGQSLLGWESFGWMGQPGEGVKLGDNLARWNTVHQNIDTDSLDLVATVGTLVTAGWNSFQPNHAFALEAI